VSYALVPLIRHLHYGLKGKDITAVQLALRHAGFRKGPPTGKYGIPTKHQVGDFKTHHGIDKEVGYGDKTHKALWPFFGPTAHDLYKEAFTNKYTYTIRQKVVDVAMFGVSQRAVIHYTQDGRRMEDFGPPPNVPNYTDCSGFATWCYKSAGAPDPNGFGYNGYGFTGTMLLHGHEVSLSSLVKGDLVFFGHPVEHVVIYVGTDRVVSHGSEIGPLLLTLNYRYDINQARRYIPT
jgi:hypothetical protein